VLGANDGLVSNLSLVMGMAGTERPSATILLTGIAGLLADAPSTAMGEWISVQSSRELYAHQIDSSAWKSPRCRSSRPKSADGSTGSRASPPADEARALAERIPSDEDTALDAMAREELEIA
jgi:hypothetical protein